MIISILQIQQVQLSLLFDKYDSQFAVTNEVINKK